MIASVSEFLPYNFISEVCQSARLAEMKLTHLRVLKINTWELTYVL